MTVTEERMIIQRGYTPGEYVDQLITLLKECEVRLRPDLGRVWCRTACRLGMHPAVVEAIHSLAKIAIVVH